MWEQSHLPAVGPTSPSESLNVSDKIGGLINELEKAHVYIERLNEENKEQKALQTAALAERDRRLAELESRLVETQTRLAGMSALEERLARMETLLTARAGADD
jgi:DNA repair exonuclease SbcCD ATPase subunit